MNDFLEALRNPDFLFFIDDYSFSAHMCAEFQDMPFMERLMKTMEMHARINDES